MHETPPYANAGRESHFSLWRFVVFSQYSFVSRGHIFGPGLLPLTQYITFCLLARVLHCTFVSRWYLVLRCLILILRWMLKVCKACSVCRLASDGSWWTVHCDRWRTELHTFFHTNAFSLSGFSIKEYLWCFVSCDAICYADSIVVGVWEMMRLVLFFGSLGFKYLWWCSAAFPQRLSWILLYAHYFPWNPLST